VIAAKSVPIDRQLGCPHETAPHDNLAEIEPPQVPRGEPEKLQAVIFAFDLEGAGHSPEPCQNEGQPEEPRRRLAYLRFAGTDGKPKQEDEQRAEKEERVHPLAAPHLDAKVLAQNLPREREKAQRLVQDQSAPRQDPQPGRLLEAVQEVVMPPRS